MEHLFGGIQTPLHHYRHFQNNERFCYRGPEKLPLSSELINGLAKKEIDHADDALEINQAKGDILQQIAVAAEFTEEEKAKLTKKLSSLQKVNANTLAEFEKTFEQQRATVRKDIDQYVNIINTNRSVFGYNPSKGLDAAQEYINEFMQQTTSEKKRWLAELQNDIAQRQKLFDRVNELTPESIDYARTLRRHEMKAFIADVEASQKNINQLEKITTKDPNLFTKKEIESFKEDMADAIRSEQAHILEGVRSELKERKEMNDIYLKLPTKYQQLAPNWKGMDFKERKNAIETIDQQVVKDYRDQQRNHRDAAHISESGKDEAYSYIQTRPINEKVQALEMLDGQFKFEKQLSNEYEGLLKQAENNISTNEKTTLRLAFRKATYKEKKEQLIPELQKKLNQIAEDAEENEELTQAYNELVDDALKEQYIVQARANACKKWMANQPLETKRTAVEKGGFEKWLAVRRAAVERFQQLPEDVQKAHSGSKAENNFFSLRYHERLALIAKLEQEAKKTENSEEVKAKSKEHKPNMTETAEKSDLSPEQKIDILTGQAVRAERWKNWAMAQSLYLEILELDPADEHAVEQLAFVQQQLESVSTPKAQTTTESIEQKPAKIINLQKKKEKKVAKAVENTLWKADTRRERRDNAALRRFAEESQKAQKRHEGETTAAFRTKDVQARHKDIAEQLANQTGESMVLNKDGEVEEIVEVNATKYSSMTKAARDDLRWRAITDIEHAKDQSEASKHYQMVDNSGENISAEQGINHADKNDEALKEKITTEAKIEAKKETVIIEAEIQNIEDQLIVLETGEAENDNTENSIENGERPHQNIAIQPENGTDSPIEKEIEEAVDELDLDMRLSA